MINYQGFVMKYSLVLILFVLPTLVGAQSIGITNLKAINTAKDDLSPRGFKRNKATYLVFSSEQKNRKADLFKSLITNVDNESTLDLGAVELFERNFNRTKGNSYPCFSKNGDQLFFTKTYTKNNSKTILYRKKVGKKWGDFRTLPMYACADQCDLAYPFLSEDGTALYFSSNMPGGFGGWDLYVSYFENGYWGPPINLGPSINSEWDEVTPFISADTVLFFSSDRLEGAGGFDVYQSTLMDAYWGAVSNIGTEINSSANELDFSHYNTKQTGFFSSDRAGGVGGYDIYYWNN